MPQGFILVIFIELSKNQTIMLLQCICQSYQCPMNFHRVEAFVNSSECFIGEKHFYIQAVGKIIAGRRCCSFVPPFY